MIGKLVSIFVGGNDLCDYCTDKVKNSPVNFAAKLEETLDFLMQIPRVFVNVVCPPDVTLLGQVTGGLCGVLHGFECSCSTDGSSRIAHGEYIAALKDLVKKSKYTNTKDFYVAFQPFLQNFTLPLGSDGKPDRTYFAPDCFHFSGKSHSAAAMALWNNMGEVAENKKTYWIPGEPLECPKKYIS